MQRLIFPSLLLIATIASSDELETIEGDKFTATIQSILPSGEVSGAGIETGLKLDALRSITRDVKSSSAKARYVLETHGDGRLLASGIALANDKFTVALAGGKEMVLPLDAVRCVRLEPELEMSSFAEALAKPSADQDKIFVKVDKQIDAINGLVLSLTDAELTFERDGQEHKLPRQRVHGIVLAQAGEPKVMPATVQLANGSRLAAKIASLAEGELQLELQGGAKAALPYISVERIDLRSSRMGYLSDLEPVQVKEEAVLTLPKPWQKDRSTSGKPLTLGTRVFPRGIGVHAASELVFEVPSGFETFVTMIGIDAAASGKGDCELEILGDDRVLWSGRVKGSDPAKLVRVDLRGADRLTLRVLPGADFDLGDHVDWADARFLK